MSSILTLTQPVTDNDIGDLVVVRGFVNVHMNLIQTEHDVTIANPELLKISVKTPHVHYIACDIIGELPTGATIVARWLEYGCWVDQVHHYDPDDPVMCIALPASATSRQVDFTATHPGYLESTFSVSLQCDGNYVIPLFCPVDIHYSPAAAPPVQSPFAHVASLFVDPAE